jgi:hypothetical protein
METNTDTPTTTTRTVAEIEAELRIAREAEAERRRQQEKELRLARRREEINLTDNYMRQLRTAITALGVECSVREGRLGEHDRNAYSPRSITRKTQTVFAPALTRDSNDVATVITKFNLVVTVSVRPIHA